jgi:transcriptional regulator with XRE-family HTH domain
MQQKMNLWLLRQLAKRGMSQGSLARRSGLSPATISRLISGERRFGAKALARIACALNMPVQLVIKHATLHPRYAARKRERVRRYLIEP